jgi:hypothetical protein
VSKLMAALMMVLALGIAVVAMPGRGMACHAAGAAMDDGTGRQEAAVQHDTSVQQDGSEQGMAHGPAPAGEAPCIGLGGCGLCGARVPEEPPSVFARLPLARVAGGSDRDPGALTSPPPTPPPRG